MATPMGIDKFGAEMSDAADLLEAPVDRMAVGWAEKRPMLFDLLFDVMSAGIKLAPKLLIIEMLKALNDTDKAIASDPKFSAHLITDQQEAFRQGGKGNAVDATLHYMDWGFRIGTFRGKCISSTGWMIGVCATSSGEYSKRRTACARRARSSLPGGSSGVDLLYRKGRDCVTIAQTKHPI